MIDLETLGIGSDCVVLSIAAYKFCRKEIIEKSYDHVTIVAKDADTFYCTVSLLECLSVGRVIDASTAKFWMRQGDRSQLTQSLECNDSLKHTMAKLKTFLDGANYDEIWAKSPTFDISILKSLSKDCNVDLGIDFRLERDVRTEIADYPQFDVRELSKETTIQDSNNVKLKAHHPVYDCVIQAFALQLAYNQKI